MEQTTMQKATVAAAQLGITLSGRPTRSSQVNKLLEAIGVDERLVRGNGYWYFIEGTAHEWYSSSVPVYRINDISFAQWIDHYSHLSSDKAGMR